jgi:hypothetical protein
MSTDYSEDHLSEESEWWEVSDSEEDVGCLTMANDLSSGFLSCQKSPFHQFSPFKFFEQKNRAA